MVGVRNHKIMERKKEKEKNKTLVFSVANTVLSTFDVYCAYGPTHTFPDLT
jgi:hypothetical protein